MYRPLLFHFLLAACSVGMARAEHFMLRVEPLATEADAMKSEGTIEFHVVEGEPFFVRSTLGHESQILLRGRVRQLGNTKFEIEYFCQVSELRTDPSPHLASQGTAQLVINEEKQVSGAAPTVDASPLDLRLTIKPLNPVFGAREANSGFSVCLVDKSGEPVANALGGLYGAPYWNIANGTAGDDWSPIVSGKSNDDGIISLSEGRESLLWLVFYAEHEGRKLYAAAYLNPDKIRSKDYKYHTVEMTDSFTRWSKPKD